MKAENSLLNVKEGDIIKALDDFSLHLNDCCHAPCYIETKFCCSPILFGKIQLAVILGVKVTQMAMRLDQLLKLGLLRYKIRLQKKNTLATAVSVTSGTTKPWALGGKISLRPQTMLLNDDLYALEPAGHGGVVFREIKGLQLAIQKCAGTHV